MAREVDTAALPCRLVYPGDSWLDALVSVSEIMSWTPAKPRRLSLRRQSNQIVLVSEVPMSMPKTSHLSSPFTATAMVTATETMRPLWRPLR